MNVYTSCKTANKQTLSFHKFNELFPEQMIVSKLNLKDKLTQNEKL